MRIVSIVKFPFRILIIFLAVALILAACRINPTPTMTVTVTPDDPLVFDGERAFAHIATQLDFGPRITGSPEHDQMVDWMITELQVEQWNVEVQTIPHNDIVLKNVIAKRGEGSPWLIIGAHYDTRIYADQDPIPENHTQPVPGANDGASGVAVLLELARVLPSDLSGEIWLVFFDAEDNGRISGWDWILGSQAFVDKLSSQPDAAVIVDMIGDTDLNIYWEQNSDQALTAEIWDVAAELGYSDTFVPVPKYRILDDHIPFLDANIPAVDIIDFDYPYWHTVDDTLDKVSSQSLQTVGDVLLRWSLTKLSIETVP